MVVSYRDDSPLHKYTTSCVVIIVGLECTDMNDDELLPPLLLPPVLLVISSIGRSTSSSIVYTNVQQ